MTFELFKRREIAWKKRNRGRPHSVVREFRLSAKSPNLLSMTRLAVEASGLRPGDRVLALLDRESGAFAILKTDEPSGWKVIPSYGGTVVISLGRFLARSGVVPGRYDYEVFPYEEGAVPGFRFEVAEV